MAETLPNLHPATWKAIKKDCLTNRSAIPKVPIEILTVSVQKPTADLSGCTNHRSADFHTNRATAGCSTLLKPTSDTPGSTRSLVKGPSTVKNINTPYGLSGRLAAVEMSNSYAVAGRITPTYHLEPDLRSTATGLEDQDPSVNPLTMKLADKLASLHDRAHFRFDQANLDLWSMEKDVAAPLAGSKLVRILQAVSVAGATALSAMQQVKRLYGEQSTRGWYYEGGSSVAHLKLNQSVWSEYIKEYEEERYILKEITLVRLAKVLEALLEEYHKTEDLGVMDVRTQIKFFRWIAERIGLHSLYGEMCEEMNAPQRDGVLSRIYSM